MKVTLKQIDEDPRFVTPFTVINGSNGEVVIDKIAVVCTKDDINITFWSGRTKCFPVMCKFPEELNYIPFTQDDWEDFADEWIKELPNNNNLYKLKAISENSVSLTNHNGQNVTIMYEQFLNNFKFAKTNKPCGKLQA